MSKSIDTVVSVAKLARLDLTEGLAPDEAERKLALFAGQFDSLVALMDTLGEVDTQGVEPLYWPLTAHEAPPREDIAAKRNTREELSCTRTVVVSSKPAGVVINFQTPYTAPEYGEYQPQSRKPVPFKAYTWQNGQRPLLTELHLKDLHNRLTSMTLIMK